MARGRPPKPTNLKLIQGNPGKRPIAELAEPDPEPLYMEPPGDMPEAARAAWAWYMPDLVRWGLFTRLDKDMFKAFCMAVARRDLAATKLKAESDHIVETPNGYPVQSPWLGIYNTAVKQMQSFASEFGLSPVARVRLKGSAQGDLFPADTGESKTRAAGSQWDEL